MKIRKNWRIEPVYYQKKLGILGLIEGRHPGIIRSTTTRRLWASRIEKAFKLLEKKRPGYRLLYLFLSFFFSPSRCCYSPPIYFDPSDPWLLFFFIVGRLKKGIGSSGSLYEFSAVHASDGLLLLLFCVFFIVKGVRGYSGGNK